MKQKPFLLIMIALIGVIMYAYYAPKESPERAITLTPKQYIQRVEQKKRERKAQAVEEQIKKAAVEADETQ